MFLAVIDTGSFAAAARRLGASAGQASKLVARLDSGLRLRLPHRTTPALSPTQIGQRYHSRLRSLPDAFDALDQTLGQAADSPRGRLRLTAPLSFGPGARLTPVLNAFALRHPDITPDGQFTDAAIALVDEGLDAAIRVGPPADSSLIARKLCETTVILATLPACLAARGLPPKPADLAGHDCILDTDFRDPALGRLAAGVSVAVRGRVSHANAEACLTAAKAGLGIAQLADFIAAASLRAVRVIWLLPQHDPAPPGIHALHPQGQFLSARVRVLPDTLADAFAGTPHWPP